MNEIDNKKINKLFQNQEIKNLVREIMNKIAQQKKYKRDSIEMLQELKKNLQEMANKSGKETDFNEKQNEQNEIKSNSKETEQNDVNNDNQASKDCDINNDFNQNNETNNNNKIAND